MSKITATTKFQQTRQQHHYKFLTSVRYQAFLKYVQLYLLWCVCVLDIQAPKHVADTLQTYVRVYNIYCAFSGINKVSDIQNAMNREVYRISSILLYEGEKINLDSTIDSTIDSTPQTMFF
jgi:hypothetical protein